MQASHEFTRRTTVIHLEGGGHEGVGEDVTYSGEDQAALQAEGPTLPARRQPHARQLLAAPRPARPLPVRARHGRLPRLPPLGLRERRARPRPAAGGPLAGGGASGASRSRVRFVVSLRIEKPPAPDPVPLLPRALPGAPLQARPDERAGTRRSSPTLGATGAVDTVDLKGAYKGTPVDQAGDPRALPAGREGFPAAWIEDPDLNDETDPVLEPHRDRITWDAPIHSVADIEGLPFPPQDAQLQAVALRAASSASSTRYDYCAEHGIAIYGGGQWELGPGRGQIQYLASLFHPTTPNDVAPGGVQHPPPRPAARPADEPARAAAERHRLSLGAKHEPLDLDDDREDHRPAAGALGDELAHVVVDVLLEELQLRARPAAGTPRRALGLVAGPPRAASRSRRSRGR